jgi:hypothetical protein
LILGGVLGFADYGGAYAIWPGNRHDTQGFEEFVHGFANAGKAGEVVVAKDKSTWHEPWPEYFQASFDGGVEVSVEQDEAPASVLETGEGCGEFAGAQDEARG